MVAGGSPAFVGAVADLIRREGGQILIAKTESHDAAVSADRIGSGVSTVVLDPTDDSSWIAAGDAVIRTYGRWNVLVNCVGNFWPGSIESLNLDHWHAMTGVNIGGTWRGCKAAVNHFKTSGGSIINIASVSGIIGGPATLAYDVAGGAIRLMSKSIALYCIDHAYPVRCNSVHPSTSSAMMCHDMSPGVDISPDMTASRRGASLLGSVTDVGHAVVYLASDESKAVTATELIIDGGRTAR